MERASVVIMCLSPDYAASVESRLLVELARKYDRRILPVVVQHPGTEEQRQQQPKTTVHALRSRSAAGLGLEERFAPTASHFDQYYTTELLRSYFLSFFLANTFPVLIVMLAFRGLSKPQARDFT